MTHLLNGRLRLTCSLLSLAFAFNAGANRVLAGPEVLVGSAYAASQRQPLKRISHDGWNALLERYVDDKGMVNYKAWKADPKGTQELDEYIQLLSSVAFSSSDSKAEVLAYWINAYNAVTVKGILREYPTTSIRNHTAKLIGYNIWKDLKLQVEGRKVSLDDIEHKYLRKMGEPRIHFAIVCASISCPKLLNEAFVATKLDKQLTMNARDFFSDRTKFTYEPNSGQLGLSQILNWFATDFGKNQSEQFRYLVKFVPDAAQPLMLSGKARVSYLNYDWGLNEQK